ncbi:MAG: methyltransferase [Rhodobacterales bacterium]|jgi:tRNA1Val (adenine37-N6)-methyltransferase|nr:methyltransferase [Pseudomonadota bacterium]NQW13728.1 methyltransferase [Rhodobacter sp.]
MGFSEADLSCDGFLGGRLKIFQPKSGYRAATDPVFLAAAVPAQAGQSVLELGCGAGVASLCLGARVPGLDLHAVELQSDYADLARLNAAANGFGLDVTCADLADLPTALTACSFDHVIANPPYLAAGAGTAASNQGREVAFREETPLAKWLDVMIRRLKPRGILSIIHLAERLPDLLAGLDGRVGDIAVKPIAPRTNRAAGRVLVRARKGAKGAFMLHPPLVVHAGPEHLADGESYTPLVQAILRNGDVLVF